MDVCLPDVDNGSVSPLKADGNGSIEWGFASVISSFCYLITDVNKFHINYSQSDNIVLEMSSNIYLISKKIYLISV